MREPLIAIPVLGAGRVHFWLETQPVFTPRRVETVMSLRVLIAAAALHGRGLVIDDWVREWGAADPQHALWNRMSRAVDAVYNHEATSLADRLATWKTRTIGGRIELVVPHEPSQARFITTLAQLKNETGMFADT